MIGSFLNVVIHRVPRNQSLIAPGSHCPVCDQAIDPYDNIPVASWIVLRGRCRRCHASISIRYPLIELVCGGLWVAIAIRFGLAAELGAFLVLGSALIAVSAIDLELKLIPKRIVWTAFAASAAILTGTSIARGESAPLLHAALGAAGAFAALLVVHLVSPRGMGFGDVRLAALLGLHLGWLGGWHVFLGMFLGFLFGSIGGMGLLVLGRKGRKDVIPFGPYLALGTMVAVLWGEWLLQWYPTP